MNQSQPPQKPEPQNDGAQLWQQQRSYFKQAGIDAWRNGEVPHYVTSNPYLAHAYARMIMAFLHDSRRAGLSSKPIYIVELGTGCGRFSYHLLKVLYGLVAREISKNEAFPFVYVMTDFVESSLDFWQKHSFFQEYFDAGILDVALFDAEYDSVIKCRHTGVTLQSGCIDQPMIVIGNYFFDTIVQDMRYLKQGKMQQISVKLETTKISPKVPAEPVYEYHDDFDHELTCPVQQQIMAEYLEHLPDNFLLFPLVGMRCIGRLKNITSGTMMLLTADKGFDRLEDCQYMMAPNIAEHGSFSLMANFHALKRQCELMGGVSLFPSMGHEHIDVGCMLYGTDGHDHLQTIDSYIDTVDNFGPDDYFVLKQQIEQRIAHLELKEIFSYIRLSRFDARLFYQFMPRIYELVPSLTQIDFNTLMQIISNVWTGYFPIGEQSNLPFELGLLMVELGVTDQALAYFDWSDAIYGPCDEVEQARAACQS